MIIESEFRPLRWLTNPHLQTITSSKFRRVTRPPLRWQRITLPDGDFIDLAWHAGSDWPPAAATSPIVLVLHGLTGSVESTYARAMLNLSHGLGASAAVMHLRGAGPHSNRLPRSYHSGETGDIESVVQALRREWPDNPLALIGFSLGGNALLKWLGEQGDAAAADTAIAVSVPFQLAVGAERMSKGASRIYQRRLVGDLQRDVREKFARMASPIDLSDLDHWNDFWTFDDRVTAKLNGFDGADDYYRRCSSRQFLASIQTPTLILHASDDPFMTPAVVPTDAELSSAITLELASHGGHVGFVGDDGRGRPHWWLDHRVERQLRDWIKTLD